MKFGNHTLRQALLAAFTIFSLPALAEVSAQYDADSGTIRVNDATTNDALRLTVSGQTSTQSMPLTVTQEAGDLIVTPRFPLHSGTHYTLTVGDAMFDVSPPLATAAAPRVAEFSPSQAVIPENTLRLYIKFTEPKARGHLLQNMRLLASDGTEVVSPFLNLDAELWDSEQRRVTILLEPGRIKQGVGPNASSGAPLQAGESYRLILSDQLQSAAGVSLDAPTTLFFRVGPAERRPIDPDAWNILVPSAGTLAPISIGFDRIMDAGAVVRLLTLEAPNGSRLQGEVSTDGGGWSLTPDSPWSAGTYHLIVAPDLEDVSGNTPGAPFDAAAGTIGSVQHAIKVPIIITP